MSTPTPLEAQRAAFTSLARSMRQHSNNYRQWAREAEQSGDLAGYLRWRDEANRCRDLAWWSVDMARRRTVH